MLPWSSETIAQACRITTYGPNVVATWPILFKIAGLYGLQDRDVLAGMIGVIGHETAGRFASIHEFDDGTGFGKYGYATSGQDYGGRGLIQTTWKSNYAVVQDYLEEHFNIKVDLVTYPDLLLNNPELAAHAACIYWVTHAGGVIVPYCKQHNWGEVIHYVWGQKLPGNQYYDTYLEKVTYAANYLLAR